MIKAILSVEEQQQQKKALQQIYNLNLQNNYNDQTNVISKLPILIQSFFFIFIFLCYS